MGFFNLNGSKADMDKLTDSDISANFTEYTG